MMASMQRSLAAVLAETQSALGRTAKAIEENHDDIESRIEALEEAKSALPRGYSSIEWEIENEIEALEDERGQHSAGINVNDAWEVVREIANSPNLRAGVAEVAASFLDSLSIFGEKNTLNNVERVGAALDAIEQADYEAWRKEEGLYA